MANHEHFREICAAASIGQATPEELFELEQHVAECEQCQQAYFYDLNLAAEQFAAASDNPSLSSRDAKESLNSKLFVRRFFERAEKEGIQFSPDVGQEVRRLAPVARPLPRQMAWRFPGRAIAALVLLGFGMSIGYFHGKGSADRDLASMDAKKDRATKAALGFDQDISELTAANAMLELETRRLKAELAKTGERLRTAQAETHLRSEDRDRLASDSVALKAQLKNLEEDLAQSQALVASAQKEATEYRGHASELEAALLANKVRIGALTEELTEKSATLDRERQLLALGHDVSDLMGARNLHIVDVVDTDSRGKTRPVFGRVFFTEGKSLVFYAYDLSEAKIQKANYQYRVWAKQEGGDKQIRSLGIFYSDDKAQRRWVFKCNDPKILSVIDSVFVTLEPSDGDPSHPRGPNLMYAYLWGQPNHP